MADLHAPLANFVHPQGAYSLSYPAHWENLVQDAGRACGFGPRERNDVGLWISVLPVSVDTEQAEMREGLRQMLRQASRKDSLEEIREDRSLRHFALKADRGRRGAAEHYWIVAGGDLVLLASTQVPESAREEFERAFDLVMASLSIHREDELERIQFSSELLRRLRDRFPDLDFHYQPDSAEAMAFRGGELVVFADSLYRRVREDPGRREALIEEFITGVSFSGDDAPSAEDLAAVQSLLVPVLKPAAYVRGGGAAAGVVHRPWLGQVVICHAIRGRRTLRFVLEKDLRRWGIDAGEVHRIALENLESWSFPERMPAADPRVGRVILLDSGDGHDAARILHPRLHRVFSPVLGSPFLAGIPDRGTLVLFPRGDPAMVANLTKKVREDHDRSAHPISPATYLVGPEGVRERTGEESIE